MYFVRVLVFVCLNALHINKQFCKSEIRTKKYISICQIQDSCSQFKSSWGKSIGSRSVVFFFFFGSVMSFTGIWMTYGSLCRSNSEEYLQEEFRLMKMMLPANNNHQFWKGLISNITFKFGPNRVYRVGFKNSTFYNPRSNARSKIRKRPRSQFWGCRPLAPMVLIRFVKSEQCPSLSCRNTGCVMVVSYMDRCC